MQEYQRYIHWADSIAQRIITEKGRKDVYTIAAGITPSGTVHIGNFREIITVDFVNRALKDLKKKVRFIYSWDDYDVFRKIPKNMPKQDILHGYLRQPIVDTPDTFGCHSSYAEHNEKEIENVLGNVGINPVFLYQSKKYRNCEYKDEIKYVLNSRDRIKTILNRFRKEPLPDDWYPLSVYCEKCNTDRTRVLDYDSNYCIRYSCECGFTGVVDFSKKGIVKLPWRVDWPMRWHYEKVDFEPGGKEHSTVGGSYSTAKLIIKELYNEKPPVYQKYEFIILKGVGGKMSSSSGNVITLKDALEIYEPAIVRYLFASTRPDAEFSISFDLDVLKIYEDFDKCERIYYGKEKVGKKEYLKQKRIYELSCVDKPPKRIPLQPSFRHLTSLVQIFNNNFDEVKKHYVSQISGREDILRLKSRAMCAWNWVKKYAPETMRFSLQSKVNIGLKSKEKNALSLLLDYLEENKKLDTNLLYEEFYNISRKVDIDPKDFFKLVYRVLIDKDRGPRLASFIVAIGRERVIGLLRQAVGS